MIKVQLENEGAAFLPSDTISGSVEWSEEQGDYMEVRLIWFTSGKGDRDFELVAVHKVASFDSDGSDQFQFTAPNRPQSFAGKLISLQWAIEAIVFPSHNSQRQDLMISSSGKEIDIFPKHPLD